MLRQVIVNEGLTESVLSFEVIMQKNYRMKGFLQCRSKQVKAAISANNLQRYMVLKFSKVDQGLSGLYLVKPMHVSEKAVCKAKKSGVE